MAKVTEMNIFIKNSDAQGFIFFLLFSILSTLLKKKNKKKTAN